MHTIVIRIWRGMVSEVYSNDPNTDVIIVDEDSDETTGRLEIQFPEHRVYRPSPAGKTYEIEMAAAGRLFSSSYALRDAAARRPVSGFGIETRHRGRRATESRRVAATWARHGRTRFNRSQLRTALPSDGRNRGRPQAD